MDVVQFRVEIVRPTLKLAGYWSEPSENLLIATALTESNLDYLKQIKGPAIGLYQCEPATYEDVTQYIKRDPKRVSAVLDVSGFTSWPTIDALQWNLRYATMICRMHYYRFPEPIPEKPDEAYTYYKKYYNGPGAATYEKCIKCFKDCFSCKG